MKKRKKSLPHCKDSKKKEKLVRKFRIYPAFLYGRLDRWLKKMSKEGLHIVDAGLIGFSFERGEPKDKEYFTYALGPREGEYSIALRYPFLEKTYGVDKKKSKINANNKKSYQIVEIDTKKIDIERDVGYKELICDRNRLYLRYTVRNAVGFAIAIIALIFSLLI